MCPQRQGISNKPTLHEMRCVIYLRSFTYYALYVYILLNAYMSNPLVHHVPAANTSIYWCIVCLEYSLHLFHIVFHHVELSSTS